MEAIRAIAADDRRDGVVFKCVQNPPFGKRFQKKGRLKRFASPNFVVTGFQNFSQIVAYIASCCVQALCCGYTTNKITSLLPPGEKNKTIPFWYIDTKKLNV